MRIGLIFLFIFIAIVFCIYVAKDLATAVLMVSLMTNFVVLSLCITKVCKISYNESTKQSEQYAEAIKKALDEKPPAEKPSEPAEPLPVNPGTQYAEQPMYEESHIAAANFKDSYFTYTSPKLCDVSTTSIDNSNVSLARSRARDRKCTDGWVTKNANYFKDNYGTEFVDRENALWWGRNEL
jgi:hypothetical protein